MSLALRPTAPRKTTRRGLGRALCGILASLAGAGLGATTPAAAESEAVRAVLSFRARSQPERQLRLDELTKACGEGVVEVDDPYHGRGMRYRAIPFRCVLDQGFAARGGSSSLASESLLLRARDGYVRSASGAQLADPNAYLAFGEPGLEAKDGRPRFSPIDRRQLDPAPFYLVWKGVSSGDPHEHPWPYQLDAIEIAPFEEAFPHTVPKGLAKSDMGWRGYALFQEVCSACHSINGEGGKVGPELNVPRSIVEYRPLDQIRDYIRNPQATRYTSMPAHPDLAEADLDALLAYFTAMSQRKHDPRAGAGS